MVTLTISANASFSGGVKLACSGMPSNGSCEVNPGSVTLTAAGTETATLIIGTTGTHAALQDSSKPWEGPAYAASLATVLGIFLRRRKRVRIPAAFTLGLLLSAAVMLGGCGGGGAKSAPTAKAGTYIVTVTATASGGSTANPQSTQISVGIN